MKMYLYTKMKILYCVYLTMYSAVVISIAIASLRLFISSTEAVEAVETVEAVAVIEAVATVGAVAAVSRPAPQRKKRPAQGPLLHPIFLFSFIPISFRYSLLTFTACPNCLPL